MDRKQSNFSQIQNRKVSLVLPEKCYKSKIGTHIIITWFVTCGEKHSQLIRNDGVAYRLMTIMARR